MRKIILALLWGLVLAQAQTSHLPAEQLEKTPATLLVSPGYTTLIELYAPVEEQFAGNANLLDVKGAGNLVALFPKAKSGETDLILRAKGRTLLFRVRVVESGAPRRYVIHETSPPLPASEPTGFIPGATRITRGGVMATAQARRQGQGLEVLVEIRSAQITPLRLALARMEVTGEGGKPLSFTVAHTGTTLQPLQASILRITIGGSYTARVRIPMESSPLAVEILARPGGGEWAPVDLQVSEGR